MIILGVVAALILIVVAFMLGEKNGDATGYERGTFDGRQSARNEAVVSAADVARRQRETMERERHLEVARKVIDAVVPHNGKRPKRR